MLPIKNNINLQRQKRTISNMSKSKAIQEIIDLCQKHGLFTNSKINDLVVEKFKKDNVNVSVILTFGEPSTGTKQCSRCMRNLSVDQFKYYQARVSGNGFLANSNAVCDSCEKKYKTERTETLRKAEQTGVIPKKPKPGDICPKCNRAWEGNWHRHHDHRTSKFIEYRCGNCNMAEQDQRKSVEVNLGIGDKINSQKK